MLTVKFQFQPFLSQIVHLICVRLFMGACDLNSIHPLTEILVDSQYVHSGRIDSICLFPALKWANMDATILVPRLDQ